MRSSSSRGFGIVAIAVAASVASAPVFASGFSVYEQSAKASGRAGAWVAQADDAAANWYNPAALAFFGETQAQFGINLITIGSDTELTVDDAAYVTLDTLPTLGGDSQVGQTYEMEQNNVTPIHLYFSQPINDRFAWGIGVTTPYGLVTEWNDRPVTFSHVKAELVTFVVNPNLAIRLNDHWSVAVGADYIYADVDEFSSLVVGDADFNNAPDTIGKQSLSGDGDDFGFNVATLYKRDRFSAGLTYRGELSPKIEGDVEFQDNLAAIQVGGASLYPDGPGSADLDLPAQAALGLGYAFDGGWSVELSIGWAGWSSFEALVLDFENETPATQDIVLDEDWDDTFSYRLGASYAFDDRHELRVGALYDESPVPTDTLRPSIPDSDRRSITVGYGYSGSRWAVDAYYMPLYFADITASGDPAAKPFATAEPDGVVDGTYESFVHLFGVTLNVRF